MNAYPSRDGDRGPSRSRRPWVENDRRLRELIAELKALSRDAGKHPRPQGP